MVDNAEKGKVDFIKFEERHVSFGNIYIDKMVTKHPRKPKTCLGEGEEKRKELENSQEENLNFAGSTPKLHLEHLATNHYRLQRHRDTLGAGKALTGHSGNRISMPRYTRNKAQAHLGNHDRVWLGCNFKMEWTSSIESSLLLLS